MLVAVSDAKLANMQIRKFGGGCSRGRLGQWPQFSHAQRLKITARNILLEGTKEPATGVRF